MALQTGVSSSKVLKLLGAGLTSSVILRNGRLSDVLGELQELIKGINEVEVSSRYDTALLAAQVRHLAQEVKDLALSRPATILNGDSGSGGNLASYILPAAAVGAMGYCYMWWKGWSFSDVMFVTKRNMATAVANVSMQLEQVSAALASTKRHLTQRLENLDEKLDEQKETSKIIFNEVNEVKFDLSRIGFDIETIQKMVSGLEGKIELIEGKQDATNAGVLYLCQVAGGIKDGINSSIFQDAGSKPSLPNQAKTFSLENSVNGLQFLTEATKFGDEADSSKMDTIFQKEIRGKPVKSILTKTIAINRSYPSGISVTDARVF